MQNTLAYVILTLTLLLGSVMVWQSDRLEAQQAPYAMYPLTLTDVNGKTYPLLADCLIVTPQGYAVILERRCPQ